MEACVVEHRYELPHQSEFVYTAGVDPSGGGPDEFTLSVCHRENNKVVQDLVRGWVSNRPNDIVQEIAKILKTYGISSVKGDKYGGEWVRQASRDLEI